MGDLLRREEPLYKDSMTLPPVLFAVSASYLNSMINIYVIFVGVVPKCVPPWICLQLFQLR